MKRRHHNNRPVELPNFCHLGVALRIALTVEAALIAGVIARAADAEAFWAEFISLSALAQPALLGLMMLLGAASAAGLPPLPGFIGKLMLLEAAGPHPWQVPVWCVVLGAGFLTLVGLARAGSILFWHVREDLPATASGASAKLLLPTLALLTATVAMSVFADPLQRYTQAAAEQLLEREAYARAVLGPQALSEPTTRPYRFEPPAQETRP